MSKLRTTKLDLLLGGKQRVWRWNFNAIAEFTEVRNAAGKPLESDTAQLRAIIWAGLLYAEPTLTLQQVGVWIDGVDLEALSAQVTEAMKGTQPDAPENPTTEAQAPSAA